MYHIGPADVLEIMIWREDALSRTDILVRPDGRISLPLVDEIRAGGMTVMELKEALTESLLKFVESPKVYINVKDPGSHKVSILGNVKTPGAFPMLSPTNVLQGIALAGGFNEWAAKDNTVVLRGQGKRQKRFPFEYSEVVEGEKIEQNILLEPGDVIVVP